MAKLKYGILLLLMASACSEPLISQAVFYNQGTVKYERKTNAYRLTEKMWLNRFFEKEKFTTDTFELRFTKTESLYWVPDYKEDAGSGFFSFRVSPDKSTQIYKNHSTDSVFIRRQLAEEKIYIIDSLRNIKWKVTGEVRDIAGFQCQKVIGVIFDSVYVVAFYTEQIPVSSGPESFGGLPGMILGLAIPRLYTNWMAVSFTAEAGKIEKPELPKKRKYVYDLNNYQALISERFGSWSGAYVNLFTWMWGL